MSMVARIVSRFVILGLLAGTVAMVVYMPTKDQIGSAVEQVARWVQPGASQPAEIHGLGPAKRRLMDQLKEARSGRFGNPQQGSGESRARRQPIAGFGQTI